MVAVGLGVTLRDRFVWSQVLWFIPLGLAGASWLVVDLMRLGRTVRPRFAVSVVGLVAIGVWCFQMVGWRGWIDDRDDRANAVAASMKILHWNVLWGGGPEIWPTTVERIEAIDADVVVVSECASLEMTERSFRGRGYEHVVLRESRPGERYPWRLAVVSRWPVEVEWLRTLPTGQAMGVRIDGPTGVVRVMVVDGGSKLLEARRPRIEAVARCIEEMKQTGHAVDFVAGDFNTPGRSMGFDDLRDEGWRFAGDFSGAWKGTFAYPRRVFWDIDHVIVSPTWSIRDVEFVSHPTLDHRGQWVEIARPVLVEKD